MNVRDAIARRRTPQRFEPDGLLLSREAIEAMILEACQAPSEDDLQPWRFLVVRDRARKETLHECAFRDQRVREAAAVIVVCGDSRAWEDARSLLGGRVRDGLMTEDEARAMEATWRDLYEGGPWERALLALRGPCFVAMNLILLATERGIATAPIFRFNEAALRERFHVADSLVPIVLVSLGLPSTRHPLLPNPQRLAASDVIRHEDMGTLEF